MHSERQSNPAPLIATLAVLVMATMMCGCQPYQQQPTSPGSIVITNNNSNSNQNGGTTPGAGNGACNDIGSVGINVPASSIHVGETLTLDATPKDKAGQDRSDACNVLDGVSWGVAGPCSLDSTSSFNPTLRANSAGTCAVSATVKGITSETRTITVES